MAPPAWLHAPQEEEDGDEPLLDDFKSLRRKVFTWKGAALRRSGELARALGVRAGFRIGARRGFGRGATCARRTAHAFDILARRVIDGAADEPCIKRVVVSRASWRCDGQRHMLETVSFTYRLTYARLHSCFRWRSCTVGWAIVIAASIDPGSSGVARRG